MLNTMLNQKNQLIELIHQLHLCGHNPATSGNYSLKDDKNSTVWISRSGVDKSRFALEDLNEILS